MNDTVVLKIEQHRLLIAVRYLNASEAVWNGLKTLKGSNDFLFLVALRSFIEYTRRGIWFLAWATHDKVEKAELFTFKEAGSPPLQEMDASINHALGRGRNSPLMNAVPGVDEPFLNFLHALVHGNPIAVKIQPMGIDKIFDTERLLDRAELDLDLFRILLYRRVLGEEINSIWKMLSTIKDNPSDLRASVQIVAHQLKQSGKAATVFEDATNESSQ